MKPDAMPPTKRHSDPEKTLAGVLAGGIGSFLMVLLFPQGVRYFFKHMFARLIRDLVIVVLAGLLTQKVAETIVRYARPAQRPPR